MSSNDVKYGYFDKVEVAKLISKLSMALAMAEDNEDVAIIVRGADMFTGLGIEVRGQGAGVHGSDHVKPYEVRRDEAQTTR